MPRWTYHSPVTVHFGDGSLAQLPEIIGNRRAALVAFPEAEGLGAVEALR